MISGRHNSSIVYNSEKPKRGVGIVKVCAFVRACVNCLWGKSDGSVGKSSCSASPRTWIQFLEPIGGRNSNLRPTKQNKTKSRLLNKHSNCLVAMIKYLMGPDQVVSVILALEMQRQGDYCPIEAILVHITSLSPTRATFVRPCLMEVEQTQKKQFKGVRIYCGS